MDINAEKSEPIIKLGQFMKWQNLVQSGGEAKIRIQGGEVMVNGSIETRRGRKLVTGDVVTFNEKSYEVNLA
ncbi:RNA-binding S4 domain-containing protein [Crocosphaera sp. UHCC 0190]|uniref:RNA-binding S4 domain-containing protein n=1 Tax=Crocosphaera sp. UHCC 0190 TaxID=3110246 RepID=UPI002B217519|nr:RNA-binding S4 domain-containing protein [Crocosphaera sp. UHCC 0190]MEA5510858.1 RNA-binding S4 domain-containing protein [Crocosphaera sp. UHCC 0190]